MREINSLEHKINLSYFQLQFLQIVEGTLLNSLQSYPQAKDNNNKTIHKMALSLEKKELIYRHFDREDCVIWKLTKEGMYFRRQGNVF